MKMQFKALIKNMALFSMVTSVALSGGVGNAFAKEAPVQPNTQSYEVQHVEQETKYSKHVMRVLRESIEVDDESIEIDSVIEKMPKVIVMDYYLASFGKKVKGNEVRRAVEEIFDIDLNLTSKNNYGTKLTVYPDNVMESLRASFNEDTDSTEQDARIMKLSKNAAMDRYIKEHNYDLNNVSNLRKDYTLFKDQSLSGTNTRALINIIYGVNLDGISTLEHSQLGILSKGQWIVKSDTDLIILESSLDDVEVFIYATDYFKEVTGSGKLPEPLVTQLVNLGFVVNEESNLLYYKNSTNESVPDSFKGQVVGTIVGFIKSGYGN